MSWILTSCTAIQNFYDYILLHNELFSSHFEILAKKIIASHASLLLKIIPFFLLTAFLQFSCIHKTSTQILSVANSG